MPTGLQQNNSLKGRGKEPISQKRKDNEGRVTLSLTGGSDQQGGSSTPQPYTFPIRPEQFQLDWPARQTVTQTITGAYQDHWGNGIGHISLSGHTGWRPHGDSQDDGYKQFMALRKLHDKYCQLCGDTRPEDVILELVVDVPQGFGHYRVSSDSFRTLKSVQSPLLYRYEISMTVLKDLQDGTNTSGGQQASLFTNNVTATGMIADSANTFKVASNQLISLSDSLLPQQTYQYVVQNGDTLQSLAQNLLGNVGYASSITKANPSMRLDKLSTGTVLNIPILGAIL